jgi:hypothetical protein
MVFLVSFEGKFPFYRRTFEELARAGWEAWEAPILSGVGPLLLLLPCLFVFSSSLKFVIFKF